MMEFLIVSNRETKWHGTTWKNKVTTISLHHDLVFTTDLDMVHDDRCMYLTGIGKLASVAERCSRN